MNLRNIGNFAGGVAGGYLKGRESTQKDRAVAIAEKGAGLENQRFDAEGHAYDELAALLRDHTSYARTVSQGSPTGGVPASMGGIEESDVAARTGVPAGGGAPQPPRVASPAGATPSSPLALRLAGAFATSFPTLHGIFAGAMPGTMNSPQTSQSSAEFAATQLPEPPR